MDPIVYKNIVDALHVIHLLGSSPEQRIAAQNYVEEFKTKSPINTLGPYALSLIDKKNEEIIRHFGLHLLEFMINSTNAKTDVAILNEISQMLLNYANEGVKPFFEEVVFIREKVSSLLAGVIERVWPDNQPNLLENVMQLSNFGEVQMEISIMTIRSLLQDTSNEYTANISAERRNEIIKSLQDIITKLFPFLFKLYDNCYKAYKQAPQGDPKRLLFERLLIVLLETGVALNNNWLSTKFIFQYEFVDIWSVLIHEEPLRMEAVECLLLLTEQKWKSTTISMQSVKHFIDVFGANCYQILSKPLDQDVLLDEYDFHKKLCEVVTNFGMLSFVRLTKNDSEHAEKYLTLLLLFSQHPSLTMAQNTFMAWNVIFRDTKDVKPVFINQDFFEKYYKVLLDVCSNKMIKELGNPENQQMSNNPTNQFSQVDFDTKDDYSQHFGTLRGCITVLVQTITLLRPMLALEFAYQAIMAVIDKNNADSDSIKNQKLQIATVQSQTYLAWETASTLFEWILSTVKKPSENALSALTQLLQKLLRFSSTDPLIHSRWVVCLEVLDPVYNNNKDALDAVLQKLFAEMRFRLPREANAPVNALCEDTQSARKKCFHAFIHLCKTHSNHLLPNLKYLVDSSEKLFKEGELSSQEFILMCEAFVLISKEIPNAKERNSFLAYLLSSHKQEWVGNDITQIVGDPGLLLKLLEIIPESNPQQQAALVAVKQKMVHIMMLFVHVTKRLVVSSGDSQIQLLLAEYLLEMVPNVMNLIRTLHLLYAPQTQQLIDEKNREHLFYVGIDEEERLLGNNCFNASALSDTQLRVYHIHRAIRSIRTHAYSLMGFACQLCDKGAQFWSNPQMFNLLGNSVFSHLDDMDNKDTKALLSFVSSFILYCPEGLYDSLLSNVLVPYSANLYKRLDAQWCQLLAPERAARVMSDEQLRKETVYEKILIELTREVIT
ncbi:exportin, partial [Acrasis kona]